MCGFIQTYIRITGIGNSPVRRYLDQLYIECSAEGGDEGNERQEFPCTVLAGQTCLEPKNLERQKEGVGGSVRGSRGQKGKKTHGIQQCINQCFPNGVQAKDHRGSAGLLGCQNCTCYIKSL